MTSTRITYRLPLERIHVFFLSSFRVTEGSDVNNDFIKNVKVWKT